MYQNMKKLLKEFKAFATKGNVVDMAVGVIIGGAFGKIVSSLVSDILMPLIGILMGGIDMTGLTLNVGSALIKYGNFLQMIIDFLIISASVFLMIKVLSLLKIRKEEKPAEPAPDKHLLVLEEIRDLLKNNAETDTNSDVNKDALNKDAEELLTASSSHKN